MILVGFVRGDWFRMVFVSTIDLIHRSDHFTFPHSRSDNLWPVSEIDTNWKGREILTECDGLCMNQIVTSLIFTPVVSEFGFRGEWLKLAQNIGLLVGAAFWGVACDIWGRQSVN